MVDSSNGNQPSGRRVLGVLLVILAISALLRLISAAYLGNTVVELPGTADQISYNMLAHRIVDGFGFTFGEDWWPATRAGEPTAHWSFLYTFYLAAIYQLFGPNPIIARILQAVLVGILNPYLVYLLGKQVFGWKVAVVSAGLTAFYGYFIYYAGVLMTEPFYITAILGSLTLTIEMTQKETPKKRKLWLAAALGLVLGCAVLLRQLFLLFIPFLLIWAAYRSRAEGWRTWLAQVAIPVCLIGVMVLPFTVFNYTRFGELVLLNTNAGYAFFWGNHPIYGTHFIPILPREMGTYHDLIPPELLVLNEAAMDKALLKLALQEILANPVRYVLLSLSRIPPYFQFWPSADSGLVSNVTRVGSFGIALPFMLYGLVRWGLQKGFRSFSSPAWLLLLFILVYSGIHILTWTLIRYRLPVDAVLLLFAGYALVDIYQLIQSSRSAQLIQTNS